MENSTMQQVEINPYDFSTQSKILPQKMQSKLTYTFLQTESPDCIIMVLEPGKMDKSTTQQVEMSLSTDLLVDNVEPDLQHLAPDKGVHVVNVVLGNDNSQDKQLRD